MENTPFSFPPISPLHVLLVGLPVTIRVLNQGQFSSLPSLSSCRLAVFIATKGWRILFGSRAPYSAGFPATSLATPLTLPTFPPLPDSRSHLHQGCMVLCPIVCQHSLPCDAIQSGGVKHQAQADGSPGTASSLGPHSSPPAYSTLTSGCPGGLLDSKWILSLCTAQICSTYILLPTWCQLHPS